VASLDSGLIPCIRRLLFAFIALSACLIKIVVLVLELDELPKGPQELDAFAEDCKLDPDGLLSFLGTAL
jgi:hypothetical protein